MTDALAPFLPRPTVERDGDRFVLDDDRPQSVGKIRPWYGTTANLVRAYAWIMSLGAEGLREVAETAVLNNNYLLRQVLGIRGVSAPYAEGRRRIEQVRYSWEELAGATGIHSDELGVRAADFGTHYWTSHHPFVVPEPMTLEPTESYSRADLDEYAAILRTVAEEAYASPEVVRTAPHRSTIHQIDHDWLDDPERWATSWRAYRRKHLAADAAAPRRTAEPTAGDRRCGPGVGRRAAPRVGLVVNPIAGLGRSGRPQGHATGTRPSALALARGAVPEAGTRAAAALRQLLAAWPTRSRRAPLVFAPGGEMGEAAAREAAAEVPCRRAARRARTDDRRRHAAAMPVPLVDAGIDLLLVAGGDGTARDVCAAVGERVVGARHPGRGEDPVGRLRDEPGGGRRARCRLPRVARAARRWRGRSSTSTRTPTGGAIVAPRLYGHLRGAARAGGVQGRKSPVAAEARPPRPRASPRTSSSA